MYDIFHEWRNDLVVDSNGDLAISTGSDVIRQRIFRRLLTNPGDYLWSLDYGGRLAQFVGTPANTSDIEAIVRTQLELEAAVPITPAPQVHIRVADAADGYIVANITYADSSSGMPVQLAVSTG